MGGKMTRACEACRVRKVRCSGDMPCAQCAHLELACVAAPAKTKRKPGVRGRLVAQLRSGAEAARPGVKSTTAGIVDGAGFSSDFFLRLLPQFEQLVYPVNPVLTPAEVRAAVDNMHRDFEDAALVHAFGAVTLNLTQASWTGHGDVAAQMTALVQHSLWAQRQCDGALQSEMPVSVKRIMTCIFNECSLMAFKRFDRAFASLREAIAMLQMLDVHRYDSATAGLGLAEVSRRQRMYWEAYIHERFLCIVSGFPTTMIPLRTGLPLTDAAVPAHVTVGFNRLILLFQVMDGPLLAHWTAQQDPAETAAAVTAPWIESKQAELDGDEAGAAHAACQLAASGRGALSELQHVDLFVTRLWLRTLVWQLALSRGLLRSSPPQTSHEGLSLHFPAERLSAQLRSLVDRLESIASIVIHGSCLLQKLFEITSTIADVLALALPRGHGQTHDEARARIEDFLFPVRFLLSFERTEKHQRDYLREKLHVLRQVYPAMDFGDLGGASPNTSISSV